MQNDNHDTCPPLPPTMHNCIAGYLLREGSAGYSRLKSWGLETRDCRDTFLSHLWTAAEALERDRPGDWGFPDLYDRVEKYAPEDVQRMFAGVVNDGNYDLRVGEFVHALVAKRQDEEFHELLAQAEAARARGEDATGLLGEAARMAVKRKRSGAKPLPCDYGEDLDKTDYEKRDFIIEGVMERNEFWLLYGPAGAGKTLVAQCTALELAMRKAWMGNLQYKTEQGWVLYLNLDMPRNKMLRRFHQLCKQYGVKPSQVPIRFYHHLEEQKKAKEAAMHGTAALEAIKANLTAEELEARIEATSEEVGSKPILIVIDTMYRLMLGMDETSFQEMGPVFTTIQRIAYQIATVMALHHTGHGGDHARGHSVALAVPDVAQLIHEGKGSTQQKKHLVLGGGKEDKGRDGFEPFAFTVSFPGGRCTYQHPYKAKPGAQQKDGQGRVGGYSPEKILAVFKSAGDVLPRKKFVATLQTKDGRPSEATIDRWRDKAVEDGLLEGNGADGHRLTKKGKEQWDGMQLAEDAEEVPGAE